MKMRSIETGLQLRGYGLYELMAFMANGADWVFLFSFIFPLISFSFFGHILAMAMAKIVQRFCVAKYLRHRGQLIENT